MIRAMRRAAALAAAFAALCAVPSFAQYSVASTHFGKNKVQYERFDWRVVRTTHFDIHYSQGGERIARFAADSLESIYARLALATGFKLQGRVPFLVHNSHPQFQQTNVIQEPLVEGIGGFTEIFKNRIVLPFEGSYPEFAHVLAHELVHALSFEALQGPGGGSALSGAMSARFPLWFSEGLAEWVSLGGWNRESEFFMIDAVTSGYAVPPTYDYGGFNAYKGGQNFLHFLEQSFGAGTVRKLVQEAFKVKDLDAAFKTVTRIELKDAGELWIREMRFAYWPELGKRDHGRSVGKRLTDHGEDGSFWNMQPRLSPDGTRIAWYSDRGTRQGLYVARVADLPKKQPKRILEGGGGPAHESFSPFNSGLAWSPDGKRIAVTAQRGGRNVVEIVDARNGRTKRVLRTPLEGIRSPDWSRDGKRIAFRGLLHGQADIYVYDLETDALQRLTDDPADDDRPVFSPGGRWIAFSSDRLSPVEAGRQGRTDIYLRDVVGGALRQVTMDSAAESSPSFSGENDAEARLAFLSDRSGLPQVYVTAIDSPAGSERAVTNLLAGAFTPTLSQDGSELVFALFEFGGWDVYLVEKPWEKRQAGPLPLTRFEQVRRDTAMRLYRPIIRENLASYQPDTADSARKPAKDSAAKGAAADTARKADSLKALGGTSPDTAQRDGASGAGLDSTRSIAGLPGGDSLRARPLGVDDSAARADSASVAGSGPSGGGPAGGPTRADSARVAADSVKARKPQKAVDTTRVFPADWPRRDAQGNPVDEPYRSKWGLDNAVALLGYSNIGGTAGQALITFSELTGDQTVDLALDIQGDIRNANAFLRYNYLPYQVDLSLAGYVNSSYTGSTLAYRDDDEDERGLFRDQIFGASALAVLPFSIFHRASLELNLQSIARRAVRIDSTSGEIRRDVDRRGQDEDVLLPRPTVDYVYDNALWSITSPASGTRLNLKFSAVPPVLQDRFSFGVARADLRRYFLLGQKGTFALRLSGGHSFRLGGGANPYRFFTGGDDFNINYRVNSLNFHATMPDYYLSEWDVPLRGYDYLQFKGDKSALLNAELRFPFVEELRFGVVLPPIHYIMGVFFVDWGGAWTDGPVVDQSGVGLGYGLRMNLGIFILRFTQAWPVTHPIGYPGNEQPERWEEGSRLLWSLGADF